ncbi:heme ABC transporter ATP-binding protein [Roseibium aggregatum]|uniref:Heme ABC transporter ATP-binding protein n=1 Tax=Roseibium aggregatum TaxID=187304 RepID=A0A939J1A6_9HYPH|nr:heme ABC transporter ATP-binding protein [Roseibium aggregatum]MBN9671936.1 heme ABC transporter ATP-binding protein [Roseibium aggregatum]
MSFHFRPARPEQTEKDHRGGGETSLEVARAGVSIGKAVIVKEVSFQARAGEFLAIIGPSGSGKTTLLKAITGEMSFTGDIRLAGRDVSLLTPDAMAEMRGVLPQISQIAFPLSVSEVVGLGIINVLGRRADRARRIADALFKVGLSGFEGRIYQDLSGGEQQRVQLARVLCQVWEPVPEDGPPRWLFLDEPVSSLDIKHQYQIMQLAADYASRGGGVVTVMHDLNLTMAFADKVLVMKQGHLLAHGNRDAIMRPELLSEAYDFPLRISQPADVDAPLVVPVRQDRQNPSAQ